MLLVSFRTRAGDRVLNQVFGGDAEKTVKFLADAAECMNRIREYCAKENIRLAIRNEYWTLMRGAGIDDFMKRLTRELSLPGPALFLQAKPGSIFRKIAKSAKAVGFPMIKIFMKRRLSDDFAGISTQEGARREFIMTLALGIWILIKLSGILKESGFDGPVILDSKYSLGYSKRHFAYAQYFGQSLKKLRCKGG